MKKTLTALVLFLFAGASNAGVTQFYFDKIDCGSWLGSDKTLSTSWLLGYMSAMNSVSGGMSNGVDYLEGKSPHQIVAWMDKYCKENPLHNISDGIAPLMNDLINGKKKK